MKKGSYWFSFLSEKEQKEFRENCELQKKDFKTEMKDEADEFWLFIMCAFIWNKTPQGCDYWEEISNRNVQ
jgi:hypothetical protein